MNEQWEALKREAGIAAEHMAIGVTALGTANYAFPAYYGQAFFALTTGFERSCKLALVVDYAVRNNGTFPPESEFRRYGHNLRQLLDEADRISESLDSAGGIDRLPRSPIHIAMVEILSDFASNVTRYYNLDLLVGTARTASDPVAQWFERVVRPILAIHYKPRHQRRHDQNAQLIETMLGEHAMVRHTAESGRPLNSLYDASLQTAVTEFSAPYVRMYVMQIVRFLGRLLSELGHRAQAGGLDNVPYLPDFFAIFNNDDQYFKSRKRWSIYKP